MSPPFAPGDVVRVRQDAPPRHCRTPAYLRGHRGVVERVLGTFNDPEKLALGLPGWPQRTLYQVRFTQPGLWPAYEGRTDDTLLADVFEHWLDPATESAP